MVPPDPNAVGLAIAVGLLGAAVLGAVCCLVILVRMARRK